MSPYEFDLPGLLPAYFSLLDLNLKLSTVMDLSFHPKKEIQVHLSILSIFSSTKKSHNQHIFVSKSITK